jgi:hypothetical protein
LSHFPFTTSKIVNRHSMIPHPPITTFAAMFCMAAATQYAAAAPIQLTSPNGKLVLGLSTADSGNFGYSLAG